MLCKSPDVPLTTYSIYTPIQPLQISVTYLDRQLSRLSSLHTAEKNTHYAMTALAMRALRNSPATMYRRSNVLAARLQQRAYATKDDLGPSEQQ